MLWPHVSRWVPTSGWQSYEHTTLFVYFLHFIKAFSNKSLHQHQAVNIMVGIYFVQEILLQRSRDQILDWSL